MADISGITDALAQATGLGLTAQQMVALCDLAMANLISRGKASVAIGSQSMNFVNLDTLKTVRDYYRGQVQSGDTAAASMAMSVAEF